MGRAKPIQIGDLRFASKEAAKERVRQILHAYRPGEKLSDEHEVFVRDLIELHPEYELKRGCGIAWFYVGLDPERGTTCFNLVRTDGSRTDFSYVSCLTPPSAVQLARSAFRSEIRDQVLSFKDANFVVGVRCAVSGEVLSSENVHVDHDPPLEELIVLFLDEERLRLELVAVNDTIDGETLTLLRDRDLATRWQAFHRSHARLRLTTRSANLSTLRRRAGAPG